ncbi:hypothetical protein [Alteromonas genovensis]|uniref:hypothetical protein n=1 Tax=Alteromonas genovensis TaxID=471225 RepID=UPI002FE25C64
MFKTYTKYLLIVFMLITSSGQSLGRGHSLGHSVEHSSEDCSMTSASINASSAVANSAFINSDVHDKHEPESSQNVVHTNYSDHAAYTGAEESGSMAMSMNDKMAMSDGNCCFDECMCETSTCSNASLVAVARHPITALTYSEQVVAEQRGKPKSISSSLFKPPIIG